MSSVSAMSVCNYLKYITTVNTVHAQIPVNNLTEDFFFLQKCVRTIHYKVKKGHRRLKRTLLKKPELNRKSVYKCIRAYNNMMLKGRVNDVELWRLTELPEEERLCFGVCCRDRPSKLTHCTSCDH